MGQSNPHFDDWEDWWLNEENINKMIEEEALWERQLSDSSNSDPESQQNWENRINAQHLEYSPPPRGYDNPFGNWPPGT